METSRIYSIDGDAGILDFSPLRFVSNLITTPVYTEQVFASNVFYYMTSPYFLITLKSRQTGKEKIVWNLYQNNLGLSGVPSGININDAISHIGLRLLYTTRGTENLSASIIKIGTPEFPLGYYELSFYEMSDKTSTDPADALQKLQTMYLYLYPDNEGVDKYTEVDYEQYSANDTQPNNIYQTNTYITP